MWCPHTWILYAELDILEVMLLLPAFREIKVPWLNYYYSLADHKFFIMKLHILRIRLLDYFGGHVYVNVDDYYDVTP
jgi:hypothetical protein